MVPADVTVVRPLAPLTMQLNSGCVCVCVLQVYSDPGSSYLSATSRGKLTLWFSSMRASC